MIKRCLDIFENHEYNNNRTEMQNHEFVNGGQYGNIILPLERILIESDGPYTKVNNKKYMPALLKDAYEEISRFYNNPDLPRKIYYNFKKILLS